MGIEKIGTNIGKEIIAWARTGGKGLLATRPVKINTQGLKYVPVLEKDTFTTSKKTLFCEECWSDISRSKYTRVSNHSYLHSINRYLNGLDATSVSYRHEIAGFVPENPTLHDLIFDTDIEFKELAPLIKGETVFRCIRRPMLKCQAKEKKLFNTAKNIKPGKKLAMREYAYTSTEKNFASNWLGDNDGILYEIYLPEGSAPSRKGIEYVLPRYSRFECISNELKGNVHKIKLKYILPVEPGKKI